MSKLPKDKQLEKLASGSLWEVRALLDQGVDVNACSGSDQETALHKAVLDNRIGNVSLLLCGGANVNASSSTGDTPLNYAAKNGRLDILWLLVAHSAEIDAQNNVGETPLHRSVYHTDVVKSLLQAGANRTLLNNSGKTPLDVAKYSYSVSLRPAVDYLQTTIALLE